MIKKHALIEACKAHGIKSITELAKITKVSRQMLYFIDRGVNDFTIDMAERISKKTEIIFIVSGGKTFLDIESYNKYQEEINLQREGKI